MFVTDFYGENLNIDQLKLPLNIMSNNLPESNGSHTLVSVKKYLKDLSPTQRVLVSQVCTLSTLILVFPATNATSERSFSMLRRNYLRSTMTQVWLNNSKHNLVVITVRGFFFVANVKFKPHNQDEVTTHIIDV